MLRLRVSPSVRLALWAGLLVLGCLLPAVGHAGVVPRRDLVGDFDGDGRPDRLSLVFHPGTPVGIADTTVEVAFGDGAGHYTLPVVQGGFDSTLDVAVTVADVDGDGTSDLVIVQGPAGGFKDSSVSVWFGGAGRVLRLGAASAWGTSGDLSPRYTQALALKLPGSSGLGVVVLDGDNDLGTVLVNDGAGRFAVADVFSLPDGAGPMVAFEAGGVASLAMLAGGAVEVFPGSGSAPVFGSPVRYTVPGGAAGFRLLDFDGDGCADLEIAWARGGFSILHGNADGSFASLPQVELALRAQSSATVTGALAATPEPSAFEGAYNLKATLSQTAATGTVSFSVDGTMVGLATVVNGVATLAIAASSFGSTPPPLLPGTHALTASYSGDATYAPNASLAGTHVVSFAPVSVTLTPTTPLTVSYGQGIDGTFAIVVFDSNYPATGTYTVLDNGVAVPSCTHLPLQINGVPVDCPYGDPDLVDAGPHTLAVQYDGDAVNAQSVSAPEPYVVLPDTTAATLSSSLNPANLGQTVTFTATVTGNAATPVGTVTFFDGAAAIGNAALDAAGMATFTTSLLSVGTHRITAVYAATVDFNAATSNVVSQRVLGVPVVLATAVGLGSSLNPSPVGQAVTFSATVVTVGPFVRIVTGTVTFYDGSISLGAATLNAQGVATLAVSTLKVGGHPITASYGGVGGVAGVGFDNKGGTIGFAASVSPVLTQVVTTLLVTLPAGFSLSVTPVPVTIPAGQTAVLQVQVLAAGGFNQPVQLGCTGLTRDLGCTFAAPVVAAGGGTTTLSLLPQGPHTCTTPPVAYYSGLWWGLPLGLVLMLGKRRRMGLLVVLLACGLGLAGCGTGNCTDLGVYPGDYTFTVTATPVGGPLTTGLSQTIGLTVTTP